MKSIVLIIFLLITIIGRSQNAGLPTWFLNTFKRKGLDKKYVINPYLKPSFLQADFNGDSIADIAVLIMEKVNHNKGILLVHCKTNDSYIFGAGSSFGGDKDFKWADKWKLYAKKIAFETLFDNDTGEIKGSKQIRLARTGILIEHYEDGSAIAGGIVYWNGKKYIWIHQGE